MKWQKKLCAFVLTLSLASGSVPVYAGTVTIDGALDNDGTLENSSTLNINSNGRLSNNSGASLTNTGSGSMVNRGSVTNDGTLSNAGQIQNTSQFTNNGTFNNSGRIRISRAITENVPITHSDTASIQDDRSQGTVTDSAIQWVFDGEQLVVSVANNAAGSTVIPDYAVTLNENGEIATDNRPWGKDISGFETITEVVVKPGVTGIGACAFMAIPNLEKITIADSVTAIGADAFRENWRVGSVVLPTGVSQIGERAFAASSIRLYFGSNGTTTGTNLLWINGFLMDAAGTKLVGYTYGGSTPVIPDAIATIGRSAFTGSGISRVRIPAAVTAIEENAFLGCELAAFYYAGTKSEWDSISIATGNAALAGAPGKYYADATVGTSGDLEWILAGGELLFTGTGAMADYYGGSRPWELGESFTRVVMEAGVTHIGAYAFSNTQIETLTLSGSTLESIGERAFSNCASLSAVSLPSTVTEIECGAFDGCTNLTMSALPSGLTEITGYAFRNCAKLALTALPAALTSIADHAFENCALLAVTNVPSTVTELGYAAFKNCDALQTITLPAEMRYIAASAFESCDNLTSVSIRSGTTELYAQAFKDCVKLETVDLPDSLYSIGEYAFEGCAALTLTSLPEELNYIGQGAFEGCTSLALNTLPEIWSINEAAFEGCTSLALTALPENLSRIGARAFYGCTSLHVAQLPTTLCYLGDSAFAGCTALTAMTIPGRLTPETDPYEEYRLGNEAFKGCVGLTDVTLRSGLTKISAGMFEGCTGLRTMLIPRSVTAIEASAFNGCTSLTITYTGNAAQWDAVTIGSGNDALAGAVVTKSGSSIDIAGLEAIPLTLKNPTPIENQLDPGYGLYSFYLTDGSNRLACERIHSYVRQWRSSEYALGLNAYFHFYGNQESLQKVKSYQTIEIVLTNFPNESITPTTLNVSGGYRLDNRGEWIQLSEQQVQLASDGGTILLHNPLSDGNHSNCYMDLELTDETGKLQFIRIDLGQYSGSGGSNTNTGYRETDNWEQALAYLKEASVDAVAYTGSEDMLFIRQNITLDGKELTLENPCTLTIAEGSTVTLRNGGVITVASEQNWDTGTWEEGVLIIQGSVAAENRNDWNCLYVRRILVDEKGSLNVNGNLNCGTSIMANGNQINIGSQGSMEVYCNVGITADYITKTFIGATFYNYGSVEIAANGQLSGYNTSLDNKENHTISGDGYLNFYCSDEVEQADFDDGIFDYEDIANYDKDRFSSFDEYSTWREEERKKIGKFLTKPHGTIRVYELLATKRNDGKINMPTEHLYFD